MSRRRLTPGEYISGVLRGDRAVLARAITLVESHAETDRALAREVIDALLPHSGRAWRVGITGVPGAGKSTFIDALGSTLVEKNFRVAVLAVDPSSSLSGGSILGDKTRMERLSLSPGAFIRPTPSGLTPGGVARRTREAMVLCEAAGYDVVLVETVGVGQGETAVADMVDFFLVMALSGAGDELQGIKKGAFELADAIVVNKCDGDNEARARRALRDLSAALKYLPKKHPEWKPRVLGVSALTNKGLSEVWATIEEHRTTVTSTGTLSRVRSEQQRAWMWAMINEGLVSVFRAHPAVRAREGELETRVKNGELAAVAAAEELLRVFWHLQSQSDTLVDGVTPRETSV